jgi:hypothetical protein
MKINDDNVWELMMCWGAWGCEAFLLALPHTHRVFPPVPGGGPSQQRWIKRMETRRIEGRRVVQRRAPRRMPPASWTPPVSLVSAARMIWVADYHLRLICLLTRLTGSESVRSDRFLFMLLKRCCFNYIGCWLLTCGTNPSWGTFLEGSYEGENTKHFKPQLIRVHIKHSSH